MLMTLGCVWTLARGHFSIEFFDEHGWERMSGIRCARCVSWMDRCVCAAGPVYQAASTGPGDEETEAALENELREEHEGYWYEGLYTTRDHLPPSEGSLDSRDTDVNMSDGSQWTLEYERSLSMDALQDFYEEEVYIAGVEQKQDMEDFYRDLALLREREDLEWPEAMPRQYDESSQMAHRRQLILTIVRRFLRG